MPIYMDYMATTPVDARVIELMVQYMGYNGHFGNPSSNTHIYGKKARIACEQARCKVACVINANEEEIYFTSGATESNNIALLGGARFYQRKGKHIISMKTEHKSVLMPLEALKNDGFEITLLSPEKDGVLDLNKLKNAIRPDTICVSIMHVNNEIGVIQDIAAIGEYLKDKGIIFHVDGAQSVGKIPIDVKSCSINLMSISGHKIYGPKGTGALYVSMRPRIRLEPILFGGAQENDIRPGTLATHQIVGLGEALHIAKANMDIENTRILTYRNKLWDGIKNLPGIILNGSLEKRIAGNLNFSFNTVESSQLLEALNELAVSTSSACSSALFQPSYVLQALGLTKDLANSSVRLSIGRYTTEEEINKAIEIIRQRITILCEISP